MERITIKHLQAAVDRLNRLTDSPMEPYSKNGDRYTANIGNYHVSRAYGGFCIHRMSNDGGGVNTPLMGGHIPARDCYDQLHAYIKGYEAKLYEVKS